jgi:metal-dependent amidase/aminoacylase/carboxypeptidase family protein
MNTTVTVWTTPPLLMSASLSTIRHYIHAHPELSDKEQKTAASIIGWLQEVGAKRIVTGLGTYGVAGVFAGHST